MLAEMKRVSDEIKQADERISVLDAKLADFMLTVPNRPHSSVPVGHDASANIEVRRWGAPPKFDFTPRPHWEIAEGAGILDFQRATKIAGTRFAVYRGLGARMERALASFFLDTHTANGYTEILPPFIVNTAALTGVGQLPKFAADMFHLEGTDLWLTPTAEVELTSLYREETLDADVAADQALRLDGLFSLRGRRRRKRYARPEAPAPIPKSGNVQIHAAGRKLRGARIAGGQCRTFFRNSACTTASCSCARATWASHLRKPTTSKCGCPSANEFMEISSCSNTEAFQARRSGIRFKPKGGKSEFVHTLNGSGLAVGRTWLAIVENYQQADGSVLIPEALRPYMGTDRIPAQG